MTENEPRREMSHNEGMIVAIDGPAGSGKSTVARRCSEQTKLHYLNSGSFYRAVTWLVLASGVNPEADAEVIDVARRADLTLVNGRLHISGRDREDELRTPEVEQWVARHSSLQAVRDIVNRKLKEIARSIDVVVEGRDMTTVVFPRADLKFYLDASLETRAKRRYSQYSIPVPLEEVKQAIIERDAIDKAKQHGSLRKAPDAIYLDTSHLTIDQVCDRVIHTIRETKKHQELQGSHGR